MPVTIRRNFGPLDQIELVNREMMREVGLLVRERIIRRTTAGQGAEFGPGNRLQPYSTGYAARRAKEGLAPTVNLQVSGDMLNNIQVVDVTDTKVSLGWVK